MCLTIYVVHLYAIHLPQLCLKCNLPATNYSICEVRQRCISEHNYQNAITHDIEWNNAGRPDHLAMSEAISDPVLQTMELHHVSKHIMGGHVVLHFSSTAAAERVRKASFVEIGSEGDTVVVITPLAPAGATAIPPNKTWRYAVVSTKLPSYEYCKPVMLHQSTGQESSGNRQKAGTQQLASD